jgi:hypothetical protein
MKMTEGPSRPAHGARWNLIEVLLVYAAIYALGFGYNILVNFMFDRFGENWPDNAGTMFFVASIVVEATLLLVALWYVVVVRHRGRLSEVGFTAKAWPRQIITGILAGLAIFIVVYAADTLTFWLTGPRQAPNPLVDLAGAARAPRELFLPLFLGSLLVPISEESYFRGFAYPALRDRIGKPWAMILVTVFFALIHLDPWGLPALILAGFALVWLYDRTQSIWPPIIAHAIWNGLVTALVYLG